MGGSTSSNDATIYGPVLLYMVFSSKYCPLSNMPADSGHNLVISTAGLSFIVSIASESEDGFPWCEYSPLLRDSVLARMSLLR